MNAREALNELYGYIPESNDGFRFRKPDGVIKAKSIIESALTELEEIHKRAEEVKYPILDMNSYGGKSVRNKIDFIINGPKEGEGK